MLIKTNKQFSKTELKQISTLREWMPFSDQEISIFQYYFIEYLKENENDLSKSDCYTLACLANETQYQMRILKARIDGDLNVDIESNNRYIKLITSFKHLIEFIKNKIILDYEKTSIENKYMLSTRHYSYFTVTDVTRDKIKKDFDLYFNL